ncbi:MAG: PfkB family carbohydrate kinase [Planctomycetaceae bacterium]|nr:PfkB family carbohydrate kinase [Planctomycetaceae bacterium]
MAARGTIHVVGSMMIDRVVHVRAIPRPGETIAALSAQTFAGGKGANQAAAAAKCGARVRMHGRTGEDGAFIRDALEVAGVRVRDVATNDKVSGSATVMVAADGENAIVIAPESNLRITKQGVERFLQRAKQGEIVLFQNECALLHEGIALAASRALRVWLNAAPADERLRALRLEKLAGLIVNETEAETITGERDPRRALEALAKRMPGGTAIITLGAQGAIAALGSARYAHRGYVVDAVDTVGCGDAFVGAYLAAIVDGRDIAQALARGNAAGALAAMRAGAMRSLPTKAEIDVASALPEGTRLKPRPPAEDEGVVPPRCTRCDYDLHGKGEGEACPECGHIVRRFLFPGAWANAGTRRKFVTGGRWAIIAIGLALASAACFGFAAVGWASGVLSAGLGQRIVVLTGFVFVLCFAAAALWAKWSLAAGLPEPRLARAMKLVAVSGVVVPFIGLVCEFWPGRVIWLIPPTGLQAIWSMVGARLGLSWWILVDLAFLAALVRAARIAAFARVRIAPLVVGVFGALLAWGGIRWHDGTDAMSVAIAVPMVAIGGLGLWAAVAVSARELAREIRALE